MDSIQLSKKLGGKIEIRSKQKLTKTTTTPGIALLLDDEEESSYFSIFYDGEYWMIKKTKIYEVPSVFND